MKINLILGLCTSCAFFYNQYCNQVHQLTRSQSQKQRPDDTDSFTPRVRSDKRSITLLLGKFLYNKDIWYISEKRIRLTFYRKVLLYVFKFDEKLWAKKMNEYWRWNIMNEAILDFPPQRMFKALNFLIQFPQHFAFTKHKFPRLS